MKSEVKLAFVLIVAKRKRAYRQATLRIKRARQRAMAFRRHQTRQRIVFLLMMCTCIAQVYAPEEHCGLENV